MSYSVLKDDELNLIYPALNLHLAVGFFFSPTSYVTEPVYGIGCESERG